MQTVYLGCCARRVAPHRVVPCASGGWPPRTTTRDAQIHRSLRVFAGTPSLGKTLAAFARGRLVLARSPATRRVARLASAFPRLGAPTKMHQVPIYGMSSNFILQSVRPVADPLVGLIQVPIQVRFNLSSKQQRDESASPFRFVKNEQLTCARLRKFTYRLHFMAR